MTTTYFPMSYVVPQYANNGVPYSGAVLKAYAAGTSTHISMATDYTGATLVSTITLNAAGYPAVSGNIVIPHVAQNYKLALYPDSTSAAANTGHIWMVDNNRITSGANSEGVLEDVASSATIVLNSTTTNYFNITGTTTITGITLAEGVEVTVKFAGALTLTNGANLINISGANITTAAGDIAVFRGESSGVVRMIDYVRASGSPIGGSINGALIYKTADQSIPNNTSTTLTWQAEGYDIGNWWVIGSPNQFTVPNGITKVKVNIGLYITGLTGGGILYVRKNSSSIFVLDISNISNYNTHVTESPWFDVVSGNTIDFQMIHNDGVSRTITYGNAYGSGLVSTWAAIEGK